MDKEKGIQTRGHSRSDTPSPSSVMPNFSPLLWVAAPAINNSFPFCEFLLNLFVAAVRSPVPLQVQNNVMRFAPFFLHKMKTKMQTIRM